MLYDKVIRYCEANNMSIYAFEKKCDIGNGTIGKWKNGSKPTIDTLKKIEKETGIPITELVSTF